MPKIFKSNNFVISDEVFTITEDEFLHNDSEAKESEPSQSVSREREEERKAREAELEDDRRQAKEFLENAKQEAQMILKEASARAEMEREKMLAATTEECETIRQKAFAEANETGYKQGLRDGILQQQETVSAAVSSLQESISRIEGEQAGFFAEHEQNLKWLALEISGKILNARIAEDDTQMIGLVKAAISTVKKSKWITVEISEQMAGLIQKLEQELRSVGDDKVDVRPIDAPVGVCHVDTPDGVIDASLETQLENLRLYFEQES